MNFCNDVSRIDRINSSSEMVLRSMGIFVMAKNWFKTSLERLRRSFFVESSGLTSRRTNQWTGHDVGIYERSQAWQTAKFPEISIDRF